MEEEEGKEEGEIWKGSKRKREREGERNWKRREREGEEDGKR